MSSGSGWNIPWCEGAGVRGEAVLVRIWLDLAVMDLGEDLSGSDCGGGVLVLSSGGKEQESTYIRGSQRAGVAFCSTSGGPSLPGLPHALPDWGRDWPHICIMEGSGRSVRERARKCCARLVMGFGWRDCDGVLTMRVVPEGVGLSGAPCGSLARCCWLGRSARFIGPPPTAPFASSRGRKLSFACHRLHRTAARRV